MVKVCESVSQKRGTWESTGTPGLGAGSLGSNWLCDLGWCLFPLSASLTPSVKRGTLGSAPAALSPCWVPEIRSLSHFPWAPLCPGPERH